MSAFLVPVQDADGMIEAGFLRALLQLKQGFDPCFHGQCIKLEKKVDLCVKSLQVTTVDNKYVCMAVKRINFLWSALKIGELKEYLNANWLCVS